MFSDPGMRVGAGSEAIREEGIIGGPPDGKATCLRWPSWELFPTGPRSQGAMGEPLKVADCNSEVVSEKPSPPGVNDLMRIPSPTLSQVVVPS